MGHKKRAVGLTAVVTGGSSGIGLWTARFLRDEGANVFDLSRHGNGEDGISHISCDVSDEASVDAAVKEIAGRTGRIDIVVNCAGFGISGAIEETETSDARRLMDVDFFGTVIVNRACIGYLRKTKGKIVDISSVAADVPIPFQAYYSASKAAISSYTLALANELRPFGIRVAAVKPGDTATGFTAARIKNAEGDTLYGGRVSRSVAKMEKDERSGMSAKKAGRYVADVALSRSGKPMYTIGFQYKAAELALRLIPWRPANRIIGSIYSK